MTIGVKPETDQTRADKALGELDLGEEVGEVEELVI